MRQYAHRILDRTAPTKAHLATAGLCCPIHLSTWDEDAIDMGLSNTDVWQKQYYDCAYTGVYTLRLALALDEAGSTDLVFIRIEYAAPLNALIDWVMYTAQTLHLQASQ